MILTAYRLRREIEPRVVHRLPGRLRLAIPALRRVPESARASVLGHLGAAALPGGVSRIEVNLISASVLVNYEPTQCTEEAVLAWVRSIAESICHTVKDLSRLPENERAQAAAAVLRRVEASAQRGEVLGPDLLEP